MCNQDDGIIIVGAGGHGKVVLSTILACGKKVAGFVDDNPKIKDANTLGYKILGDFSFLNNKQGNSAIMAIGDNKLRKMLASDFPYLNWQTIIHPSVILHSSVKVGQGTVIFAGAIVQPESSIGDHVIVNTGATIDHDCIIQSFAHIAPGCHLAGGVQIEEGTLLGIGTNVIPLVKVGKWSVIGAGSVLIDSIENYSIAKGVPAKSYKSSGATHF